jgi:hypothetical protein
MQINNWTDKHIEVILMSWDANESITSAKSSLNTFMAATNMSPIHRHFPTSSYTRGTSCIDFIIATPGIIEATHQSGYLPFYDGAWISDHRGLYVDITYLNYFSHQPALQQAKSIPKLPATI